MTRQAASKRPARPASGRGAKTSRTATKVSRGAKAPQRQQAGAAPRTSRAAARRRLQARRARAVLLVGGLFAAAVLATNFPVKALLSQRHQLSTTAAEVRSLHNQNDALARQAGHLGDPATIEHLARTDFGFVHPGQQAYDVLPPSGSSSQAAVSLSGHVPLQGPPVAPGSSRSDRLLGAGDTGPATAKTRPHVAASSGSSNPGFLGRLAHTLEFWR